MRILVAGAGGVGGYFGGLLAQAGHTVSFLARGAHREAIERQGLVVRSLHGDFTLRPARLAASPEALGPQEAIVVAVKHYDLAPAARQLTAAAGEQSRVVPLLNGVDAHRILAERFGRGQVVGGTCSIASRIEAPGVIRQESRLRRIAVGRLDGLPDPVLDELVSAWRAAGVQADQSASIVDELWLKMVFIDPFGSVTALARAAAGDVRSQPAVRALLLQAMREVEAVGRAAGARLPADCVARAMATVDSLEAEVTSSLQRDVAAGRRFELEAFSGTILRLAGEHGIEVPVHAVLDALLRPALARADAGRE
jgi:2-dehydropantoate 2-reductase